MLKSNKIYYYILIWLWCRMCYLIGLESNLIGWKKWCVFCGLNIVFYFFGKFGFLYFKKKLKWIYGVEKYD